MRFTISSDTAVCGSYAGDDGGRSSAGSGSDGGPMEGPDGPLYADFHSLRHSYIALLDKSGATLKEAMQLARHSDPKLTMAVYGRALGGDRAPGRGGASRRR